VSISFTGKGDLISQQKPLRGKSEDARAYKKENYEREGQYHPKEGGDSKCIFFRFGRRAKKKRIVMRG